MKSRWFGFLALAVLPCGAFGGVSRASYVPEPQPLKSAIEVHAFYYPGTEQMAEWDQVEQTLPHIKPLLGWYDESNPEVVDWQIKWAVEHGIHAFCVDWYWNQGDQRLDHWIKAYYKARYRRHLKWYMMYANHNEPGAHSEADTRRVMQFWLDNYLKTPEYYTIDGRPVIVLWNLNNLAQDYSAEAARNGETITPAQGLKRAVDLMQHLAREAGLPGLHLIDMYHGWKYEQQGIDIPRNAGYSGQMIYNFDTISYHLAPESRKATDQPHRFDYDLLRPAVNKWWRMTSRDPSFPFWPMIPTGWNDQPRSFQSARVITGRTPEKFRAILSDCRAFCEERGFKRVIIAPLNEWQEGSYVEPNAEFGFSMYDAIRDVFCEKPAAGWPANLLPQDVGLGPYDYPKMPHLARTSWDFDDGVQGWYRNPYGTAYVRNPDGCLHFFRSFSQWPAIRTRIQPFAAKNFKSLRVRMRLQPDPRRADTRRKPSASLAWGGPAKPLVRCDPSRGTVTLDTENQVHFMPIPDGSWHEYRIDLSKCPTWKGDIDELWFDPCAVGFTKAWIDWMRLETETYVVNGIPFDPACSTCVGDLYLPEKVDASTPVALLVHGGGWSGMGRADVAGIAEFYRTLGFAVFNADYRLCGAAAWPACGDDCVKAGNFVLNGGLAKWGVHPKRLHVCGGSAGGHLALWTGLKLGASRTAGIVALSPIADPAPDFAAHPGRFQALFHARPTPALLDSMSPLKLIAPNGPPILVTHATDDAVVPFASAKNFVDAYVQSGNRGELYSYTSKTEPSLWGHYLWRNWRPHRLNLHLEDRIRRFLQECEKRVER